MSNPPNPNDPSAPDGYNDPLTPQEGNPNDGQTSQYGQIPQDPQTLDLMDSLLRAKTHMNREITPTLLQALLRLLQAKMGSTTPTRRTTAPTRKMEAITRQALTPTPRIILILKMVPILSLLMDKGIKGTRTTKEIRFHTNKESKTHTDRINPLMGLTLTRLHNTFLRTLVPQTPMVAVPR